VLKDKSDEELMLAYQMGDENAFKELYERYAGRVLGYLRKKTKSEAQARDVFQGAFLKLHRARGLYDPAYPLSPWLFTICRNELLDAVKREKRNVEEPVGELSEHAAPHAEVNQELDLSALSPGHRQILELRYQNDASFEEIARILDTTPSNARQLVSRSIKALKGIYGKK
jgi:RNA polymerase sigma factor (sigma-70 family)